MKNLKSKKGFTLVEVIVVLVILAILAAILIPSLTGYIAEANKKAVIAEARSVLIAAQTSVSLTYSEMTADLTKEVEAGTGKILEIDLNGTAPTAAAAKQIYQYTEKYSEMKFATGLVAKIKIQNIDGAFKVTEIRYYDGNYTAYMCTYGTPTETATPPVFQPTLATNVWSVAAGDNIAAAITVAKP
ncbi:MAG: prepilin-type N-terminal cleavage/methylation domain-containing protein [Clostridia bacterium]